MARSLAERLQAHEQQKAKLAEQEAKLKVAERKARTRRMIEAGGLVEKTGLLDLDTNALYGALLSLREAAGDKKQVEQWAALGGRAFSREANAQRQEREPIVITFAVALPGTVTVTLRAAGFRFNKVLRHWEGLGRLEDAQAIADTNNGIVRQMAASSKLDTPAET